MLPSEVEKSPSVTNGGRPGLRALARRADPRRWELWTRPPRVIAFQLTCELVAAVCLGFGIVTSRDISDMDWLRFIALAGCATAHIQLTRQQEARRRSRLAAVHIDLTGMWIFPAALLLPIELALLLLALVRGQRWINSRRPPHRFLFTTMTLATSALLAQRLFSLLDPDRLTTIATRDPVASFGALAAAGLVYAGLQAAAIGGVLALGGIEHRTLKNVLGSKTDNLLEAATVGMGIVTAVLLLYIPPALSILVLVGVLGNRLAEISQLQEEADTDPKTGVLNMRGWTESAERAFQRASRSAQHIALIMLDLDYFKWINDTYGHPAGDDMLRAVAHMLRKATRPTDVVGRFGGEEFILLLPDTDVVAAEHAADRIRTAVAGLHTDTTGKHGAPTTISDRTTSVGVAVYPTHGDTLDDLLHAADAAVYEAKERGRNQVRLAAGPGKPSPA
ncbi:MAG: diguanylate cyclase [Actinophytocola sp.]|nr:diguanylate cyclase [Actinophytocola sp.]